MDLVTPDSAETDRLLRQAHAGDRRAFEELFARYRAYLLHVVTHRLDPRLQPRADPSDVVQETQAEAFRRLEDYLRQPPMPFRVWLRKLAVERLLKFREHHAAARRSVHREVRLPERSSLLFAQQFLVGGSTPSQQLSRRELAQRVNRALTQLPPTDHEILLLRHFEGLSYDEIGAVLEITAAAARKRYGRALLRLQNHFIANGLLESQP
jgi:RNA polymerase sigma-70 factor (ECF subfamily)